LDCAPQHQRTTIDKLLCPLTGAASMSQDSKQAIKEHDVVALTTNLSDHGLVRGQVGTIVDVLAPGVFEVEFSDTQGRAYAQVPVREEHLMVLHYAPCQQAA
jgi:hypothetical protein